MSDLSRRAHAGMTLDVGGKGFGSFAAFCGSSLARIRRVFRAIAVGRAEHVDVFLSSSDWGGNRSGSTLPGTWASSLGFARVVLSFASFSFFLDLLGSGRDCWRRFLALAVDRPRNLFPC